MSNYEQIGNQNINSTPKINEMNSSNDIGIKTSKEYHPIEFYSLGKLDPNRKCIDIPNNNFYKKRIPKLNYNRSSHELFDRNILSVNNPYFDRFKEVKPKQKIPIPIKDENNYLNPLKSLQIRNEQNFEGQQHNNINSLEWFHLIKNKIYIVDHPSRIKKGNNISLNEFYQEKGFPKTEKNNNSRRGYDTNIGKSKSISYYFNIKRFKKDNEFLINQKQPFQTEKENVQIDNENNYWRKLRIERELKNNTDNNDMKNPKEKKLKNNLYYFDKNNTNIIRHKNWWIIDP
jgi:hypothetical protein